MQAFMLQNQIQELIKSYPNSAIIICGDFNTKPENGCFKFLNTGILEPTHPDITTINDERPKISLTHPLKLKSAYELNPEGHFITNVTASFQGCIDYIFYSTPHLDVSSLLLEINSDFLTKYTALPSIEYPSDHMSLLAKFTFKS